MCDSQFKELQSIMVEKPCLQEGEATAHLEIRSQGAEKKKTLVLSGLPPF